MKQIKCKMCPSKEFNIKVLSNDSTEAILIVCVKCEFTTPLATGQRFSGVYFTLGAPYECRQFELLEV